MSIYNRRMFNNVPNNMRTNSRGVGITSGLVPVIKANQGKFIDSEEYQKLKAIADQIVPQQQGFFARNAPALFDFFTRVSEAGEGGKPLIEGAGGLNQSPAGRLFTGLASAAPALGNIKPYEDQAAKLAASKLFDIEAEKMTQEDDPDYLEVFLLKDDPDTGATAGQKIPILRSKFDLSLHSLAEPKEEDKPEDEFIEVYLKTGDDGGEIGQKIPIKRSEFDINKHNLAAPDDEDDFIEVYSKVENKEDGITVGQKIPIKRNEFDANKHDLAAPADSPEPDFIEVYAKEADEDKGITKGQKLSINRNEYDVKKHDLEGPADVETDFIDVFLLKDDDTTGGKVGQKVPIKREDFDPSLHNLEGPKEVDKPDDITVYSKVTDDSKGITEGQGLRISSDDFDPKLHNMAAPSDDKISNFQEKLNYIDTLDVSDEKKQELIFGLINGNRNVLSAKEEKDLILFGKELESKLKIAEPILNNAIADATEAAASETNFLSQKALLDDAITGRSFFDTRKYFGDLKAQFPSLYSILPSNLQETFDSIVDGSAVSTDAAIALSNRATLSTAKGGAIPGNLNTKEFDAIVQSNSAVFFHPEAQSFIIDLNIKDAQIKQEKGQLVEELFTKGTVNGEEFNLADGAIKILNITNQKYEDYKNSEEYQAGVNRVLNVGELVPTSVLAKSERDIIINDENIGQTKELFKNGELSFVGYSNADGVFVNPANGLSIKVKPNTPVYSIFRGEITGDKATVYLATQDELL